MAKKGKAKRKEKNGDPVLETLQTLLIAQLAQSGLTAHQIRKIARVGMSRVTSVTKHLRKKKG